MPPAPSDRRIVMTLDAGGTKLVFSALSGGEPVVAPVALPAEPHDLERSLGAIVEGFRRVRDALPEAPAAISFAFPGPADYPRGVIVAPPNLPAYRDVALGPMLEDAFGLPVFINNDGDLFAYGEAVAGFLPWVNGLLCEAGSPKRFSNLLGVTLGTGFGAGIVRGGELFSGDNSVAAEIWLFRHKGRPETNVEEGASIRAVRRVYAELEGVPLAEVPEARELDAIAAGRAAGNRAAALEAFRRLGEVAGDAVAQAASLVDGLVVVGGGLAGAHRHFLPALVAEMNGWYTAPGGGRFRRLVPRAFDLEDEGEREEFLRGEAKEVRVPGSGRTVTFDAAQRVGVGVSRLGTSEAIAVGAYAYAVGRLG